MISDEAGETSSEVSWTTAEEVEELPVLLYGIIVGIMIILGIVVAMSSRRLQQKEYVELIHIENTMAYVSGTLKTGDRVIVGGASKVVEGQAVRDSQ